jgi:site-specific DNA-cytosine methylase
MLDVMTSIKSKNPNVNLLMENVKMKKEFEEYITNNINKTFPNINKYLINSSLVSAQNRQRYYWTNISNVTQPEDKGILLKDIIETGYADRDKSHRVDANYFKGGNLKSYFEKHRKQLVFSKDMLCHVGDADINGNDSIKRVYSIEGKSPTLSTCQGGHREPKILCGAWRGRYIVNGIRQDAKMKTAGLTEQRLEVRIDEKTNTLSTVQKDNNIVDINNMTWRKLTPLECCRLQTVPDNYFKDKEGNNLISNSQQYKCLGNGFTVDIIAHILKGLKK